MSAAIASFELASVEKAMSPSARATAPVSAA